MSTYSWVTGEGCSGGASPSAPSSCSLFIASSMAAPPPAPHGPTSHCTLHTALCTRRYHSLHSTFRHVLIANEWVCPRVLVAGWLVGCVTSPRSRPAHTSGPKRASGTQPASTTSRSPLATAAAAVCTRSQNRCAEIVTREPLVSSPAHPLYGSGQPKHGTSALSALDRLINPTNQSNLNMVHQNYLL